MKKYFAEMVGTMILVLMGCGVAVSLNCSSVCDLVTANAATVIGTSLAFGLSVVAMAYAIGGISGCHINPAITFGMWLSKRISGKDAIMYVIFQTIGAIIGAAVLYALAPNSGLGANGLQPEISLGTGFLAEVIFTFVFVLVVLGTTDSEKGAGNFAGLAIGLSLVLVHLVCIRYTGTSVNPARSIGPAIFAGGAALDQLWIFIVAPLIGAALSALVWKCITCDCKCCKKQ